MSETASGPLRVRSVVGLAYDELRAMIVDGRLQPGARVGQAELAEALGISRGSVREALRRLAGDGMVVFEVNRGFFVAEVGLERVLERLEARLLLEPGIARLAAERRNDADLDALRRAVAGERTARSAAAAHDASRAFHAALLTAIEAGDGALAESLMRAHVESAWRHWARRPSPAATGVADT